MRSVEDLNSISNGIVRFLATCINREVRSANETGLESANETLYFPNLRTKPSIFQPQS